MLCVSRAPKNRNFTNLLEIDVQTGDSIVVFDENKVGKSNFIRASQLILDLGLSECDRQLGLEHFWDGLGEDKLGETPELAAAYKRIATLANVRSMFGPPIGQAA